MELGFALMPLSRRIDRINYKGDLLNCLRLAMILLANSILKRPTFLKSAVSFYAIFTSTIWCHQPTKLVLYKHTDLFRKRF